MARKSEDEELAALSEAGFDDDPDDDPEDEPEESPAPKAKKAPDGLSPADLAKAWNTTGIAVRRALRKVDKTHPSRERWTFKSTEDKVVKLAYAQLQRDAAEPKGKAKGKAKKANKAKVSKKS